MAIGEIFLSAFIQAVLQQLVSSATMALARREKVESYFRKLSQSLEIIRAVLDDAEEKQLIENSVKVWLESLRDLAYDLDDILDEIMTRALIQESKGINQNKSNLAWMLIPTCHKYTPSALIGNYKMMSRIKSISKSLEDTVKSRIELNLRENHHGSYRRALPLRSPSTSLNEPHVYGRDEDKDALIKMLLTSEETNDGVPVIPIVGMGGIGKTTLAQMVYNDKKVQENFHKRAWVCVDQVFNVQNITKTILDSITDKSTNITDLNLLQVSLQQELSKIKFLIVLDDLWNKEYDPWVNLCRPFLSGLPGSRIIVTTRDESIASVVGSPRNAYHMKLLTDKDCLLLLAQHSRRSLDEDSEFRTVGLGLVKKCKGLPLAAKTLGGLLRAKETKEGWERVLNSKIWDLPEENKILPVLRLSYFHLPPHLKHLFAYCSIFPKDYEFDPNELVRLWMAEGFLEQQDGLKRKEDLGLEYFNDLLSRSFFQRPRENSTTYVMHDLINDLAQFVSVGTCYRLDEKMGTNQEYLVPHKTRHGSFLRHEYEVFRKFKAFRQVKGLRTFLPMPIQNSLVWPPFYLSNTILVELVPELLSLRVLSLSGYSITEVPGSVCDLIHIRYLNLSGTLIITLPDSVANLLRLETLLLSNCRFLCKLPSTLGNLSNLRHLDNSNTDQLKDMPVEIGKLKNLQTLPKIILSKGGAGFGLKDLRNLKLLRRTIAILELQNVTNSEDVKEASLRSKDELDDLQLTWGSDIDDDSNIRCSQEEVIDLLRPHESLEILKVESYRGARFPSWIGDPLFCKMSSISITSCAGCLYLPPFGQLPMLKTLRIESMSKVKRVGKEFYGHGIVVPFPKLETLRFNHMPQWEEWSGFGDGEESKIEFPCLQNLAMFNCHKLTKVSPLSFPSLRGLDIEDCNKMVLQSFCNLDSLSFFKVESVTGLSHLPRELTRSLSALEVLECCNCKDMVSIWPDISLEILIHLKRIVIADCSQLVKLGQGQQHFPCNLEVIELFLCPNLITLPNDLSSLSSLRELIIKNCMKFLNFPKNGIPPNLKRLEILSCNALESLPNNISNLERLEIKDCSSLRTWAGSNFPVSLKKLAVKNCTKLDPVPRTMFPGNTTILLEDLSLCSWPNFNDLLNHLNGFSNLVELNLSHCSGLKHIPEQGLPPKLRALSIEHCSHLKSLPSRIKDMSSLLSLEIRSCSRLNNFPQCDLPPHLTYLRIWDSKNFKPLKQWGLHRLTSLQEFSICGGFKDLELLGDKDGLFPSSLEKFSIARFPKLTSLGKVLEDLESLRHLSIMNCVELHVLPSEQLLERLWSLEISGCRLLSPKCARNKGDYWYKIAGIPCVEIDGIYVYRQNLV